MADADSLARAHRHLTHCRRVVDRLEDRAGAARFGPDSFAKAKDELEMVCEGFAGSWRDSSLEDLRQAGGRINRYADKLVAAMALPDAQDAARVAAAEYHDQQAMAAE